jgi:hypothetical protein
MNVYAPTEDRSDDTKVTGACVRSATEVPHETSARRLQRKIKERRYFQTNNMERDFT